MAWTVAGNIRGPQGPAGPTGPQGPTGTPGAVGPAGINWRNEWDDATEYEVDDAVYWGGSSYFVVAPAPAVGTPPTGTSSDPGADDSAVNTGWAPFALQGATGPQGIQGPPGETGATGATGPQGPQGIQGPAGPTGSAGAAGAAGATGTRGSQWFVGTGAPGTISGSLPGDKYLDTASGDVYDLS
jgi:hypothetical protein